MSAIHFPAPCLIFAVLFSPLGVSFVSAWLTSTRWHCDIKPENILRTGGRFKLADFGETRILRSDPDEQPQAIITGGTMTYGKVYR